MLIKNTEIQNIFDLRGAGGIIDGDDVIMVIYI
jgi:hypothetical protein